MRQLERREWVEEGGRGDGPVGKSKKGTTLCGSLPITIRFVSLGTKVLSNAQTAVLNR